MCWGAGSGSAKSASAAIAAATLARTPERFEPPPAPALPTLLTSAGGTQGRGPVAASSAESNAPPRTRAPRPRGVADDADIGSGVARVIAAAAARAPSGVRSGERAQGAVDGDGAAAAAT